MKRDVPEGGWKTFETFGSGELIAKKPDGKLMVAKNLCRHRGYKVAEGCGKGPITCKYHGQRFNYESQVHVVEMGEFVFLPGYLGASKILRDFSESLGEEFGSFKQTVKAPFHLWMQNTADPNHLSTTHKKSFASLFDGHRPERVWIEEYESSYSMKLKDETLERYSKYADTDSKWFKEEFFHGLVFPNLSVTSFLGVFFSVESANPRRDGSTEVETRFFVGRNSKAPKLLRRIALENNKQILLEDKELIEKWAMTYRDIEMQSFLPGDERIKAYLAQVKDRGLF